MPLETKIRGLVLVLSYLKDRFQIHDIDRVYYSSVFIKTIIC